ncbi:MAG: DUF4330 domain-containing protein [Ruminococcaceae bacterium]|nr:DUF4330 domain-containing protein [Oscillospiraceae bacterium]
MNTKQKKHRFNIIDVLIILVVLAICLVMYYYTTARNEVNANSEVEIQYTVEVKEVHRDNINKISIGDKVVETVRDQQIGEVVKVDVSPAYKLVTDTETGKSFVSYYPPINPIDNTTVTLPDTSTEEEEEGNTEETELEYEYYNVKVTIKDTVKKSESGYNVNGFDVAVGQLVYFRVPRFVNEGYCINIVEK